MENGRIWLIDGHHRLRALAQLGEPEFAAYVIEEAEAKPYRMYFNGERVSPWMKKTNALRPH
jgi:ParB-like chromosome segregation protein Spo0J